MAIDDFDDERHRFGRVAFKSPHDWFFFSARRVP